MIVRDCLGLITPSNKFIMKDVDAIAPDQEFQGIDQFQMSELYSNIAEYEIYGIESKDNMLIFTYGDGIKDVKLQMNQESAKLLKNVLKDAIDQLPDNNVNKNSSSILNKLMEDLDEELFIIDEYEEE